MIWWQLPAWFVVMVTLIPLTGVLVFLLSLWIQYRGEK